MGMDVYGKNPRTEEGEYFRNNIWSWGPLAGYIRVVVPDIAAKCCHWDMNEGDGLDAADAIELAERLQAEIDSGRCERFARTYAHILEGRADDFEQNVRNFVTFLRGCGGFAIW